MVITPERRKAEIFSKFSGGRGDRGSKRTWKKCSEDQMEWFREVE